MLALSCCFFPTSTLTTTFDVGPTSHYYLGYVFLWDVLLFACEKDFLQYIYKVSLWCVFSSSWLAILMWEASQVSFRSYIYKVSFAAISQWYYQWYCSLMITSRGYSHWKGIRVCAPVEGINSRSLGRSLDPQFTEYHPFFKTNFFFLNPKCSQNVIKDLYF